MNLLKVFKTGATIVNIARDPNIHRLARGTWGGMKWVGDKVFRNKKASQRGTSAAEIVGSKPNTSTPPTKVSKRRQKRRPRTAGSQRSTRARNKFKHRKSVS